MLIRVLSPKQDRYLFVTYISSGKARNQSHTTFFWERVLLIRRYSLFPGEIETLMNPRLMKTGATMETPLVLNYTSPLIFTFASNLG